MCKQTHLQLQRKSDDVDLQRRRLLSTYMRFEIFNQRCDNGFRWIFHTSGDNAEKRNTLIRSRMCRLILSVASFVAYTHPFFTLLLLCVYVLGFGKRKRKSAFKLHAIKLFYFVCFLVFCFGVWIWPYFS